MYDKMSFLLQRGNHHYHTLALKLWHLLRSPVLLQLDRKAKQKLFSLVGIKDGAPFEKYRGLNLGTFLKELHGMLQFELEIMLVRIRAEAYFLDDYLGRIGLHLLRLLLLLIEIFLIVNNLAYRRVCLCTYLYQIKSEFVSHLHGLRNRIDSLLLNIVAYETNSWSRNLFVDSQSVLVLGRSPLAISVRTACSRPGWLWTIETGCRWSEWCCDKCVLLKF